MHTHAYEHTHTRTWAHTAGPTSSPSCTCVTLNHRGPLKSPSAPAGSFRSPSLCNPPPLPFPISCFPENTEACPHHPSPHLPVHLQVCPKALRPPVTGDRPCEAKPPAPQLCSFHPHLPPIARASLGARSPPAVTECAPILETEQLSHGPLRTPSYRAQSQQGLRKCLQTRPPESCLGPVPQPNGEKAPLSSPSHGQGKASWR